MTSTQSTLYNSLGFWHKRLVQQQQYIIQIQNTEYEWEGRKAQLYVSAKEMLNVIGKRLIELS